MTVAELIAALQKMPQDAPVRLRDEEGDLYDSAVQLVQLIEKQPDGCPHCNVELPLVVIE